MVFLETFYQMIILYKHYTEFTKSYYKRFLFSHRFYFVSGLYQICKEKGFFLAVPVIEIVNQI